MSYLTFFKVLRFLVDYIKIFYFFSANNRILYLTHFTNNMFYPFSLRQFDDEQTTQKHETNEHKRIFAGTVSLIKSCSTQVADPVELNKTILSWSVRSISIHRTI